MQEGQQAPPSPDTPQWQYRPNESPEAYNEAEQMVPHEDTVTWTASEYIAHHKSAGWFLALGLGAVVASIMVYLMTKDVISTGVILLVAAAFGIFAARQPQVLQYTLDTHGLKISDKFYAYGQFKSFAVMREDGVESISLLPLHRFMPVLKIYYDPSDAERISNLLADYLPHEERKPDPIDRLMRRVRF